jgi:hypothetical protein
MLNNAQHWRDGINLILNGGHRSRIILLQNKKYTLFMIVSLLLVLLRCRTFLEAAEL